MLGKSVVIKSRDVREGSEPWTSTVAGARIVALSGSHCWFQIGCFATVAVKLVADKRVEEEEERMQGLVGSYFL
jgi:hypothetical protein